MWLVARSGEHSGEPFEIADEGCVLGRGDEADITLSDARASRMHARITTKPGGGATIEDLGSGNGTFVNGARIDKPVDLTGDEQIQIGSTVFATMRYAPVAEAGSATVLGTMLGHTPSGLHRLRVERSMRRTGFMAARSSSSSA